MQKRIIFIYNNDIAAARVELWSSSKNAKYAESSSTKSKKKYKCSFFQKNYIIYVICYAFMVDIKI